MTTDEVYTKTIIHLGVGESGVLIYRATRQISTTILLHLVRWGTFVWDLEVLLCPFPPGNCKSHATGDLPLSGTVITQLFLLCFWLALSLALKTIEYFLYWLCNLSGFQMTVEYPKPKQLLWPITTEADSAMNQSQFLAIACNSLEAREKSHVHSAIGNGFASHWSKNWRDSFKPITKRSNRSHVITFDSHLNTALLVWFWFFDSHLKNTKPTNTDISLFVASLHQEYTSLFTD